MKITKSRLKKIIKEALLKEQSYKTYKIKKGDTLSQIAQKANLTGNWRKDMKTIAKINKIKNVNFIRAGDTLQIPSKGAGDELTGGMTSADGGPMSVSGSSKSKDRPRIVKTGDKKAPPKSRKVTMTMALKFLDAMEKKKQRGERLTPKQRQVSRMLATMDFSEFDKEEPENKRGSSFTKITSEE
jgi:LysM repeat protein